MRSAPSGLGVPRPDSLSGANGRVALEWSVSGDAAATYTTWLSPREAQPFVNVAANVTGNQAVLHPGPVGVV